ncbi:MAG: penicillin acylase family protein [Acidobacteriota bacterium]|nr:penicillin acylase family protein [Acidobacteriota bacterium]
MRKIIPFCFILNIVFVTACWAQTAPALQEKTLTVAGLKDKVTVRRDERGIPYIEARDEADLYFAQGFVTAQDRLWQMDLYRRVARGETAELFGKTVLEEDKRWRKFGFAKIAEDSLQYLSPELKAALENYARGVNAYIATLSKDTLPIEFKILQYSPREWRPTDTIVIGKILADGLSSTWSDDLLRVSLQSLPKEKQADLLNQVTTYDVILFGKDAEVPSLKSQVPSQLRITDYALKIAEREEAIRKSSLERIGFYAEDLAASNNWVVSGKRTIDGKPLLANDPHLRNTQPPIWYLINLSSPNGRVAGVSTAGIPGVIIGHNEHFAWGSTNVGPDVQDLYVETFNAEGKYKTPNGWETPTVRKEEIKVRNNPLSPDTVTEVLEVVETRNGVIVLEEAGKKYALKWTARDPKNDLLAAFSTLAKAKNWNDFRNALKNYAGAMQNFVYADKAGNIGWIAAGKVPIRKTGDGSLPYDGATDAGDWTGFIPFDELPQLYNPPEGFIVTANQRTIGKSYKYHDLIARAHTVSRAKRLHDLLKANSKVSINDMRDFQFDTFSEINSRFAREVVKEKAASDETLKLLAAWDGRMNADSKAALVADSMRSAFRNKITAANLGAERAKTAFFVYEPAIFDKILTEKPKDWLPKEFTSYSDLIKACETEAKANLTKQIGADEAKWTWGERVKTTFPHPLAVGQFVIPALPQNGSSGAGASPNVGSAVSMRFIAAPADWDATRFVIPTGQSGDPKSAHYKDQLEFWANGNTPVFPFSKSAVETATKELIILTPR